ncbi:hypothetical protein HANVADRAFT_119486 [Hanseniaspora valbyensis NRRL Y-1626]|uniref:Uncharacterized protein n=1 Tax=Hanseniaspora valbyensis NRRL Y-1626 TaxID=766949 RepID=A0A1B7TF61_9ASCO|nr:hypothetical protein HANVADRAFT_119486 [Hanseniaspora valbyensis NRRL Y-1626]
MMNDNKVASPSSFAMLNLNKLDGSENGNNTNLKNFSHHSLQRLKFNDFNNPKLTSSNSSGSLSPHSPSFNDLSKLSIYRNQGTDEKQKNSSADLARPNIYSSMYDIKTLDNKNEGKNENFRNDFIQSKPMAQSTSYNFAAASRKYSVDSSATTKLRSIKEKDYHHYKKPKLTINSGNNKVFNKYNARHYNKVAEITLMGKPFSDILFKKNNENPESQINANDSTINAASPTNELPAHDTFDNTKFVYGTAKEHGFGSNIKKEIPTIGNVDEDLFPLSPNRPVLTNDASINNVKDGLYKTISDTKLNRPQLISISSASRSNEISGRSKIMKSDDSSNLSLSSVLLTKKYDIKLKDIVNDEFLSTEVLLNPIKEILIKQIQMFNECDINDSENNNKNKEESKDIDSLMKIEKIINDVYITKHISTVVKKLNTAAISFNKESKKINDLNVWKKELEVKIKQLQKTVENLHSDQLSQNLKQLFLIKEQTETKFNHNMQNNEESTKQYAKIVAKYEKLKDVKLTKLENWKKSINKMEKYEQEKNCKFLSYYDIAFIVLTMIFYYYCYYYRK